MSRCRICKHNISTSRNKGADGTDEQGNPIPFWTDDPIYTQRGLAGIEYKGQTPIRPVHIIELQQYYSQLEVECLSNEDITSFLPVDKKEPGRRCYIEQLRISAEKILKATDSSLEDYFKYDYLGEDTGSTQSDWTDVDRSKGKPALPKGKPVRALHIEELRRGIPKLGSNTIFQQIQGIGREKISEETNDYFNEFKPLDWVVSPPGTEQKTFLFSDFFVYQNGILHAFFYNTYKYCKTNNISGYIYSTTDETLNWSESMKVESNDDVFPYMTGIDTTGEEVSEGSDYIRYILENSAEHGNLDKAIKCHFVSKYTFPKERILGISDGGSNQTFSASSKGIITPIVNEAEIVYVNNIAWRRVDNFNNSTPSSNHYTINYNSGVITFGNGDIKENTGKGRIPTEGAEIKIFITLLGGGNWTYKGRVVDQKSNTTVEHLMVAPGKMWYVDRDDCRVIGSVQFNNITTEFSHNYNKDDRGETWSGGLPYLKYPIKFKGDVQCQKFYGPYSLTDSWVILNTYDTWDPEANPIAYCNSDNVNNFNFQFNKLADHGNGIVLSSVFVYSNGQRISATAPNFMVVAGFGKWKYSWEWEGTTYWNIGYDITVRFYNNFPYKHPVSATGTALIKCGDIIGSWSDPINASDSEPYEKTTGDVKWIIKSKYFRKWNVESHVGWVEPSSLLPDFLKIQRRSVDNGKSWGFPGASENFIATIGGKYI
jgi:hypothetical protein